METQKQYYITKEQYIALKAAWAARPFHSASEHIIYNTLRSLPAFFGFTKKTKSIQGNDPWYGYHLALKEASRFCSSKNPWEKPKQVNEMAGLSGRSYDRWEATFVERKKQFVRLFGIEMPEDIMDKLIGAE